MEKLTLEHQTHQVDEITGEIVDDAQGYGYKDKQKATKAMWWKFNGGKEKKNNGDHNSGGVVSGDNIVDNKNADYKILWIMLKF